MKDNDEKKQRNTTIIKKRAFIEQFRKSLGNITMACKSAEIDRSTYYRWLDEDQAFAEMVADVNEESIDFAESSLMKQINSGDTTATIFYLKTKGKKRGYVEKTETESVVKAEVKTEDSDFDLLPDDVKDEIVKKIQDAKHKRYMEQHYGKENDK